MNIKLVYLITIGVTLLTACRQKTSEPTTAATQSPATAVETPAAQSAGTQAGALPWASHTDPICEMDVEETVEDTVHYQGKVYGFCSAHCKGKFQENPGKYAVK